MHEQEARAHGIALTYELVDFTARGLDAAELPRVLDALEAEGFAGVNVTYPFKQEACALLGRLTPEAKRIGAVNTIRFRDRDSGNERLGFNTDVGGFADAVRTGLAGASLDSVVQVGAGGGGSATAFALLSLGTRRLTLFDASAPSAAALAERLGRTYADREIAVGSEADLAAALRASSGIVNATPLGMARSPGTPVPSELIEPRHWVADIVYFPLETQLLRDAAAKGCRLLDGSAMAVGQAAAAFEIFTGRAADHERMLASFRAVSR
jgi:shikimate dehydrogenase